MTELLYKEKRDERRIYPVAAATPDLKVADPVFNREQTWKMMQEAAARDVKILVFPELGLTGYTCSDLFLQDTLIDQAKEELLWLLDASKDMDMLTFIGLPWMKDGKLYNVAAVIKSGELLVSFRRDISRTILNSMSSAISIRGR
ncbi:MAG: nitrilase-related carbon-nitrogen hydrolase [Pilosibacter sp.]